MLKILFMLMQIFGKYILIVEMSSLNFFNINRSDANRDLFIDFSKIFAKFIPVKKIEEKSDLLRRLEGSRCEGNNPDAIFVMMLNVMGVQMVIRILEL